MNKLKLTTRDFCQIAMLAALMAVMAQISIPMPSGVPMTMQTFAVSLAGVLLGARKGMLAALVYSLMGAFGVPVFANFTGGIGKIFGPTGGFILSFPIMAYLIGLGADMLEKRGALPLALGLVAGAAANYAVGMAMFAVMTGNSLSQAFLVCVLPFLPTAVIKAVAAGVFGVKIRKIVGRYGMRLQN